MTEKSQKKIVQKKKSVNKKLLSEFIEAFYQKVPVEDRKGWKEETLNIFASSMYNRLQKRDLKKEKVCVFTPRKSKDGWSSPHTVIQIVNDDMPFIVDSIVAELASQNLTVEVLFHPVLNVKRDKSGVLEEVAASKKRLPGYLFESYMFIRLEQMLSADNAARLVESLQNLLQKVRVTTTDWHACIDKMNAVVSTLRDNVFEEQDFLKYVLSDNFTFLGYHQFDFIKGKGRQIESCPVEGSGLGVLRLNAGCTFGKGAGSPEIRALESSDSSVLITKLIDSYSVVHRRAPMDAISIKILDKAGKLVGMHLFVGLFTSSVYSCRTSEIPMIRKKVDATIDRCGFLNGTHDRAALEHTLEKMPRDELFQVTEDELYSISLGIVRLRGNQKVSLFTHMDRLERYMSCLLYVPRDLYNTKFRLEAEKILEKAIGGGVANYFVSLDNSLLARILFTVRLDGKDVSSFDRNVLEQELTEIGTEWDERLKKVLIEKEGKKKGSELAFIYGRAFDSAYHEKIEIDNACHDIRHLEELIKSGDKIHVDFYRLHDAPLERARLKVYHLNRPVPLSDILPILDNMGLKARSEMPYEVKPKGYAGSIWMHDFVLISAKDVDIDAVKDRFEDTFLQVWHGHAENDPLNELTLSAHLSWREVRVLRAYNAFMQQSKFPFSKAYIEQVLSQYPKIAHELITLFGCLHNPKLKTPLEKRGKVSSRRIEKLLQDVKKLDHDRILRNFKALFEQTLRTNFFKKMPNGSDCSCLTIKLDSKNIPELPLPRPHVEIFVYSTRVEGVHLRGGEIARGGIRWSDRHDDFRTEILGLMKSQMVKNAVIVPVGSKGGFVVKQPPEEGGREAFFKEGVECYKLFIKSLLDITDNNVKGRIVRPKNVVFHDGIDPYLVVAADKGTATFSDIANKISMDAGFWLNDAFASGGVTGYDHKVMGITARGAWESVKRHFREMDKNIQEEPFTAIGVGDMSGDVFGNGLLLSKQTRLLAAFNHLHIFCDPNPDIKESYAERSRLFKERGGWDSYRKDKLSKGGKIYDRSDKNLKLTPEIKDCFGLTKDMVTPAELIQAILRSEVELLWFGGIGTFIKSSKQSHADADDKANDSMRIDGRDVRAKVIGEGANLGVTQLGRIEYAKSGGRINTDFIDNSAGVDCSDHEVNIKILLSDVMANGEMTLAKRDKLLENMTDEVSELVLKDNYQQTQSLSLLRFKSREQAGVHADFIRELERNGVLNRKLEGLPDDEAFAQMLLDVSGLTRPELSVMFAYAKTTLFSDILKTEVPDDPDMEDFLFEYFPKKLHKFDKEIRNHKLKREIISTMIVNLLVNAMGPVFVRTRILKTGSSMGEVVKAFVVVLRSFGIQSLWKSIEELDNQVAPELQLTALYDVSQMLKRSVTWFLRFGGDDLNVKKEISVFKSGVESLEKNILKIIPKTMLGSLERSKSAFVQAGMPEKLAQKMSVMHILSSANDIIAMARQKRVSVESIAAIYFQAGECLSLDWLRLQSIRLTPENDWQARSISGLIDDFYIQQASLVLAILSSAKKGETVSAQQIEDWFEKRQGKVDKIVRLIDDLNAEKIIKIEMLMLISQRMGQFVHQVKMG